MNLLARLAKLTAAAVLLASVASGVRAQETIGSWKIVPTKSAFDDAGGTIALIKSDRLGLAVKCDRPGPNSVYVVLSSATFLGDSKENYFGRGKGFREVDLRLDGGAVDKQGWMYDDTIAFALSGFGGAALVNALSSAKELAARVYDYRFNPTEAVFELKGAEKALALVHSECGDRSPGESALAHERAAELKAEPNPRPEASTPEAKSADEDFKTGNFGQAALAYAKMLKGWPNEAWAPSAAVGLAASLGRLNRIEESCVVLKKIEERYPRASPEVRSRGMVIYLASKCAGQSADFWLSVD